MREYTALTNSNTTTNAQKAKAASRSRKLLNMNADLDLSAEPMPTFGPGTRIAAKNNSPRAASSKPR